MPDRSTCCIQFQSPHGASRSDLAPSLDSTPGNHSRTFSVARSSDPVPEPDSWLPQLADEYASVKTARREVYLNLNSCAFPHFSSGRFRRAATPQRIRLKFRRFNNFGKAAPPKITIASQANAHACAQPRL